MFLDGILNLVRRLSICSLRPMRLPIVSWRSELLGLKFIILSIIMFLTLHLDVMPMNLRRC